MKCWLLLLWMLAPAAGLLALEKPSAKAVDGRLTADADQVSLKPVFLFSMRGRRDPFVPYPLLTATAQNTALDLSQLTYKGLVEVHGEALAFFQSTDRKPYILRGSHLEAADGSTVEGIHGRVRHGAESGDVILEQGERKLVFTFKRVSKRLDDQGEQE